MASFDDVEIFADWEGRPAVVVTTPSGGEAAFVITRSEPGVWTSVNPADVTNSARPLPRDRFELIFSDELAEAPETFPPLPGE